MLHLVGMKVQDIFETLEAPTPAPDDPYEAAVGVLNKYFEYKPNITLEQHIFRKLVQRDSETVTQFATRLTGQAEICGFGDSDEQIRDQLVERVRSDQLQKKFLDVEKLSLQKALEMARTRQFETKEATSRCMSATPATPGLQSDCHSVRRAGQQEQHSRGDNGRQPGRSWRSLARDVDNRATTNRFRHVQREATFAVDVESRGTMTTFVGANGRKENPTGARLRQDRDRAADDQHKVLWPRTRTMEPRPRTMSGLCTRSHGSDRSVACRTWTLGSGTLRR